MNEIGNHSGHVVQSRVTEARAILQAMLNTCTQTTPLAGPYPISLEAVIDSLSAADALLAEALKAVTEEK